MLLADRRAGFDSADQRHLEIEEDHVGTAASGQLERLAAVARQASDLDAFVGIEQRGGALTHQPMVIGNEHPDRPRAVGGLTWVSGHLAAVPWMGVMSTDSARPRASTGLAGRLAPDVLAGLGAISRVATALVGAPSLSDLAERGLAEVRDVLDLEIASLYLPDGSGRPLLERRFSAARGGTTIRASGEIAFDEEAWRLAVSSGLPLVFHEEGSWLVEHPFEPSVNSWLVLPLPSSGRLLGVIVAASDQQLVLEPVAATVLTLLGDLLTAGIATAELRQALERTEAERERMRLAAAVHDGLAQDLAVAKRELALLDSRPSKDVADASHERLQSAVTSAHTTVRERLKELAAPTPLGGVCQAVQEICERFVRRGLAVRLHQDGPSVNVSPPASAAVARVLTEALTNVEKHAWADGVEVHLAIEAERVTLLVSDDGVGFAAEAAAGPDSGHFGVMLMQERARAGGGVLTVTSAPDHGTLVRLQLPA